MLEKGGFELFLNKLEGEFEGRPEPGPARDEFDASAWNNIVEWMTEGFKTYADGEFGAEVIEAMQRAIEAAHPDEYELEEEAAE